MLVVDNLKILIVHSRTIPGGLTQIIKGICSGIRSKNVEIVMVLLSPFEKPNEDEFFLQKGVKLIYLEEGNFFSKLKSLKKTIQSFAPHVVHTHGFQGLFACWFLNLKVPHMSTLHGNLFLNYKDDFKGVLGQLIAFFHMLFFRMASHPVLVSASLKNEFLVPNRSVTILNGVDKSLFFPIPELERPAIRVKLNIKPDKFVFISTGQKVARKRPSYFFESFLKLSNIYPNLEFHFLGSGNLLHTLKEQYKKLPNVFFHGKVNNITEWLNAADCFLSASVSEGFPNAPLEAYSCGTPMILSAIGPHLEIGAQIPNDVMFFNSQEEVEGLMKKAIENKYRIANTNAFSQEEMANNYLQLYLAIANQKH